MRKLFWLLTLIATPASAYGPKAFKKTVTASGTAEALKSTQVWACGRVTIRGLGANTGSVYIGASDVSKTTKNGLALIANSETVLDGGIIGGKSTCLDLNKVYVDADTNSEGVAVFYWER